MARTYMPIMKPDRRDDLDALKASGVFMLTVCPMEMFTPHEQQAQRNHSQSCDRLAQRGGLSACEAVAILEDRPWRRMPDVDAYRRLNELFEAAAAAA